MYHVSGSIPACNFIQLPKMQSLGLTGRYLYFVFRPVPSKYFVVHIEVTTESGLVVRVSFSNLFKEFKSTSTWLQFPFVTGSDKRNTGGTCINVTRWTLLALDLQAVLSKYVHAKFANVKNIKLCSNLLVKNVFTSDIEFSPLVESGKDKKIRMHALPREMAFPVAKGWEFSDNYEYIRFPSEVDEMKGGRLVHGTLKGRPSGVVCVDAEGDELGRDTHSETDQKLSRKLRQSQLSASTSQVRSKPVALACVFLPVIMCHLQCGSFASVQPKKHSSKQARNIALAGGGDPVMSVCGGGEVHVYAKRGAEVTIHRQEEGCGARTKHRSKVSKGARERPQVNCLVSGFNSFPTSRG